MVAVPIGKFKPLLLGQHEGNASGTTRHHVALCVSQIGDPRPVRLTGPSVVIMPVAIAPEFSLFCGHRKELQPIATTTRTNMQNRVRRAMRFMETRSGRVATSGLPLAREAFKGGCGRPRYAICINPATNRRGIDFEGGSHFSLPPSITVELLADLDQLSRVHSRPLG